MNKKNKDLSGIDSVENDYGFKTDTDYEFISEPGISKKLIKHISNLKGEPDWMLKFRLDAYEEFLSQDLPKYGPEIDIDFDDVIYYAKAKGDEAVDWDELPENIRDTFDKLGISDDEKSFLAGTGAQFESEMVLKKVKKSLSKKGVIFLSMDEGLKQHPDLVKEYFGKIVSYKNNKFAALNSAIWSGGTFIYVPKGVDVGMPLQTYFRINMEKAGQFERTLIVVEEGAKVHYVEGCTAPIYSNSNLHSAVVEVVAKKNSHVKYSTVQNWSRNVLNFATKKAKAEENAFVEWVDGNVGSGINYKYPQIILKGDNSVGNILSVSIARTGQEYDAGGKLAFVGKNTKGKIVNKSVCLEDGLNNFRSWVNITNNSNANVDVSCDSLVLDKESSANSYPYYEVKDKNAFINHEAKVGTIEDEKLFYLKTYGLDESKSKSMIVLGFLEPITKELPFEYAIELNKLLKMTF